MAKTKKTSSTKKTTPGTKSATPPTPVPSKKYYSVPYPRGEELPVEFAKDVMHLESLLGMPVWMIIQDGEKHDTWDSLTSTAKNAFFESRFFGLERGKHIALLIDSPGGHARSAYEIAVLLQKHCGGFTAVVPRRAKSAATLISLGADNIILGEYGELGPLDVQFLDEEREEWISGLDEVQSLERLHAFTMSAFDQTMFMLTARTSMKAGTLIPHVTNFVTQLAQPMFENVDVVRYTQMSRRLKVGEEYARRLLLKRFNENDANNIARRLVEVYPEHGFIIDNEEATRIGLKPTVPEPDVRDIMCNIARQLPGMTALGRIIEK